MSPSRPVNRLPLSAAAHAAEPQLEMRAEDTQLQGYFSTCI